MKPQFEVGRGRVGKGGVVRDPAAHRDAIAGVIAAAAALGWQPHGLVGSPITGPAGNHEYLLWLREPGAPGAAAITTAPMDGDSNDGATVNSPTIGSTAMDSAAITTATIDRAAIDSAGIDSSVIAAVVAQTLGPG